MAPGVRLHKRHLRACHTLVNGRERETNCAAGGVAGCPRKDGAGSSSAWEGPLAASTAGVCTWRGSLRGPLGRGGVHHVRGLQANDAVDSRRVTPAMSSMRTSGNRAEHYGLTPYASGSRSRPSRHRRTRYSLGVARRQHGRPLLSRESRDRKPSRHGPAHGAGDSPCTIRRSYRVASSLSMRTMNPLKSGPAGDIVVLRIAALLALVMLLAACEIGETASDRLVPATAVDADSSQERPRDEAREGGTGENARPADTNSPAEHVDHEQPVVHEPRQPPATSGMIKPEAIGELPTGEAGSRDALLEPNPRVSGTARTASFRTACGFSHMNFDDPIVYPGQSGASHLHAYFGNTDVDANSTASSIANSGNSTCAGGALNRTGYWVPAVLDARTEKPIKPDYAIVYYKSGGIPPESIKAMPDGLRMIGGNANVNETGSNNPHVKWHCTGSTGRGQDTAAQIPTDCERGGALKLAVEFPQCWDGKNLDSADHKSHMAYHREGATKCPPSHPVPIPKITMNVRYSVTAPNDLRYWRLASDMYDSSLPGGMSAHSDWFNGWDRDTVQTFLDNCFSPARDCGTDNLNNGTGLKDP